MVAHHLAVHSGISLPAHENMGIHMGRMNWYQSSVNGSGHLMDAERPKKIFLGRTHLVSGVETDVLRNQSEEAVRHCMDRPAN